MHQNNRHKVFISFQHEDQRYKDEFVQMMEGNIVDRSVEDGDIDDGLLVETIRQKIRDEFIADATVTVVLVGACTWQRKYVDWEIGSSLSDTRNNPRCGLLGIILPSNSNYGTSEYKPCLMPPRLADNCSYEDPYVRIYDWTYDASSIHNWIHRAFVRRYGTSPDNSRPWFGRNRSGSCSKGWQ